MATAASPQFIEAAHRRPGPLFQKYEHSVVDVAVRIHDAVTGSGNGIPTDEAHELVRWLHWRINYAWDLPHSASSIGYDMAVKMLAMTAIDLAFHPERGIVDTGVFQRPD